MKEFTEFIVPDWCKDKCYNSGTIACVSDCAGQRDARYFVGRPELTLKDIAPFPSHDWTWNMSPEERQACTGLYLTKIVEEITDVPPDPNDERRKRIKMAALGNEAAWKIACEIASMINGQE